VRFAHSSISGQSQAGCPETVHRALKRLLQQRAPLRRPRW
jgi:hypothetical protein